MTKEQIAELRKLDTLPPGPERRLAVYEAAVNVMPRLLDEREALLEALRLAKDELENFSAWDDPRPPMAVIDAAIAKAEAE